MKTTPIPYPIVAALAFTTGIMSAETPAEADSSAELAKKLAKANQPTP